MRITTLAAIGALWPAALMAQTPTAESATAQEQKVRIELIKLLGSDAGIGQRPVQITANADHYDLAVKLGSGADAPMLTGSGTPDADGVWTIDHIRVQSPAKFEVPLKQPPGGTVIYTMTLGEQSGKAVLDPALAKPSTLTSTLHDYVVSSQGGPTKADTKVALMNNVFATTPAAPGRVDMTFEGSIETYALSMTLPNSQEPLDVGFGSAKATGTAKSASVGAIAKLYRDLFAFNTGMPAGGAPTPEQKQVLDAAVRQMMVDLTELMSAGQIDETFQNVTAKSGDMQGSAKTFELALQGADEAGTTHLSMKLGVDGLVLPDFGLGPAAQLVPTALSLTPSISGVPTAALSKMMHEMPFEGDPPQADIAALFAPGTLKAGLDTFSATIGPAKLDGHFSMSVINPNQMSGTGQVTATSFDALQQMVAGNPQTAQFGAVLVLAKGIGRNEAGKLVWDIAYQNGRVLVNGQDLSAMAQGGRRRP